MAISTAIQRGPSVYVYDENNRQLFSRSGELHGYAGGSVSIRVGSTIYTYDDKGKQISAHPAR